MALSGFEGFEGFEKRLELIFFSSTDPIGLRRLTFSSLDKILTSVQCRVVSAVANSQFDSYVLSESSLFIYPHKLIIKTCGTTSLLHSLPLFLHHASSLGLTLLLCKYTRGSFIFPLAQPAPHTNFNQEVFFLEKNIPISLQYRKSSILPSYFSQHKWHVYSASYKDEDLSDSTITVEVCMSELDRVVANRFFRWKGEFALSGNEAGKEMTRRAGIEELVNPFVFICDFAFDPCGYSMNGLNLDRYTTIHVTPEEGYSYASYECVVKDEAEIVILLEKLNCVFRAGVMSVSVTGGRENWKSNIEVKGMSCRSREMEDFAGAGIVTYQTFVSEIEDK